METLKDKITVMTDYPQIISQDIKNIYTIHKLPLKKYSSYNCGYIMQDGTLISCEPYRHNNLMWELCKFGDLIDLWDFFVSKILFNKENEKIRFTGDQLSYYDVFAIVYLGWVKVAAYHTDNSNELNWKYITCRNLTEAQTNVLFKQ